MVDIQSLHNQYKGRVFIVGNGPSLLGQQGLLARLQSERTHTCNGMYLWKDLPFLPTFYGISSNKRHHMEAVNELESWRPVVKLMLKKNYPSFGLRDDWVWVPANFGLWMIDRGFHGFGDTLPVLPHGRATPLTQCQVMAWMGFTEFCFLGVDETSYGHVYGTNGPLAERRKDGGLGEPLNGKEWLLNEQATFDSYVRARQDIEVAGSRIYDCTPNGRLNREGILPYAELADVLNTGGQ